MTTTTVRLVAFATEQGWTATPFTAPGKGLRFQRGEAMVLVQHDRLGRIVRFATAPLGVHSATTHTGQDKANRIAWELAR
jgi:hypothetical protein